MKIEHGTPVLFVCEKRSQVQNILAAWHLFSPETPAVAVTGTSGSPGGFRMSLPRRLPISAVPSLYEPKWQTGASLPVYDQNGWADRDGIELLQEWPHQIVCACDADYSGAYMFMNLIRVARGDAATRAVYPVLHFISEDPASLLAAMSDPGHSHDEIFRPRLALAEAKRFFDANWAVNALPLMGDILRDLREWNGDGFISKYGLQLLYHLRDTGPASEGDLLRAMRDWAGTGKYAAGPEIYGMGSAASRGEIISKLSLNGLITGGPFAKARSGRHLVGLSDKGREFLERMHPRSCDPDLPFRIELWGRSWPESRPAVERYINTFFSRQKRFMAAAAREKTPEPF